MIVKTQYICEKCGKHFTDESECYDHETNFHVKPAWKFPEVVSWHKGRKRNKRPYPSAVEIIMQDGAVGLYQFVKIEQIDKEESPSDEQKD